MKPQKRRGHGDRARDGIEVSDALLGLFGHHDELVDAGGGAGGGGTKALLSAVGTTAPLARLPGRRLSRRAGPLFHRGRRDGTARVHDTP